MWGKVGQCGAVVKINFPFFLPLACKSLFFNALKLQKKCAEVYEGQYQAHLVLAESGTSTQN